MRADSVYMGGGGRYKDKNGLGLCWRLSAKYTLFFLPRMFIGLLWLWQKDKQERRRCVQPVLPTVKTREHWPNREKAGFQLLLERPSLILVGPIVWRQSTQASMRHSRLLISCQGSKTEEGILVRLPTSESTASMAWRTITSLHFLKGLWPLPRTPILGKKLAPVWLKEWGKAYAFLIGWEPGIFLGLLWSDISVNIHCYTH